MKNVKRKEKTRCYKAMSELYFLNLKNLENKPEYYKTALKNKQSTWELKKITVKEEKNLKDYRIYLRTEIKIKYDRLIENMIETQRE